MFKFSLQSLQDYRDELVFSAMREFEASQFRLVKAQETLYEHRDQYVAYKNRLMDELVEGNYHKEPLYHRYLEGLKAKIIECLHLIQQLKQEVEMNKRILIQAKQQQKVVEELKVKEQRQYLAKVASQERNELDEFAVFSHFRAGR